MIWHNRSSYPLSAANFILARKSIEDEARARVERRNEWGKRYAELIRRYGRKAVEKMSGERLNALMDGRDGVAVKHYSERVPGEAHGRRWTTQRIEYVRVRTCKGKRT
jgi:hypothetical protein